MKILIDMNLSPAWENALNAEGFDAVHWSRIGPANAVDPVIMTFAAQSGMTILTHDLDFGIALAHMKSVKPSVVQIRSEDLRPAKILEQICRALRQMEAELDAGALLTIDPKRTRLRLLPLGDKI